MPIVEGKDYNSTYYTEGGTNMLYGLYYYYLDNSLLAGTTNNRRSMALQLPTIQSLSFLPFFNSNELTVVECDLDKEYFKISPSWANIKVYRSNVGKYTKELPNYSFQDKIDLTIDVKQPLARECYPYSYYLLSDGINPPLMIKPQDIVGNNITPVVETYITQNSKYKLYIKEMKNDSKGELEGLINNTSLLLPIGTNVYQNFLTTNGNSYQATNNLAMLENNKNLQQATRGQELNNIQNNVNGAFGLVGGITSLLSGNIVGGIGSLANTGANYYMGRRQNENNERNIKEDYNFKNYQLDTMRLATERDYINTPRTMKTLGNDAIFNLNNTNGQVKIYRYTMKPLKKSIVMNYYKTYGYRINEFKTPNYNTHKYWNFIKTSNCNIDSATIPMDSIKELETIFNSGITFWHVENNVNVGDYDKDNDYVGGY